MDIEDLFEEWDADDLVELLKDNNSSFLKPTRAFSSTLRLENSNLDFFKPFVNQLYLRVRTWSYLKRYMEER